VAQHAETQRLPHADFRRQQRGSGRNLHLTISRSWLPHPSCSSITIIVTVERTGRLHLAAKRAFEKAGYRVRVVHPFATKKHRQPANPGDKTDDHDLAAIHRATINGFALQENALPEV